MYVCVCVWRCVYTHLHLHEALVAKPDVEGQVALAMLEGNHPDLAVMLPRQSYKSVMLPRESNKRQSKK